MDYTNKYLKYKKKYLNLKKILGGNIFNKIYDKLIKIFRDINKINITNSLIYKNKLNKRNRY